MRLHQFRNSHYCEKARWILQVQGINHHVESFGYSSSGHKALLAASGSRTVPALELDAPDDRGRRWLTDSTDIALWAEEHGGATLIPEAHRSAVMLWEDWADESLGPALYALHAKALVSDPDQRRKTYDYILGETKFARFYPVLGGVFEKRYLGSALSDVSSHDDLKTRALSVLRLIDESLTEGYLVGGVFTLADLVVATMVGLIHRPPQADPHTIVPPGWRASGLPSDPVVDRVIDWQTRIYAEHRRPTGSETVK